jgi:solute carrier family 25, member 39/40
VQNQSQFCVANTSTASPASSALLDASEAVVSDCAAEETQRRTFNSTLDGLRKIARNEGVWTLWRGLSPTLMMAVPGNVIYFAGYDWLRYSHKSPLHNRVGDAYGPLAAGSIARVLAAVAVSPIEMLRTRMQATSSKESGVMRATVVGLKDMVSNEGYHTLWRGLTLTFWRDVPFSALYWWGYEYGRNRLSMARRQADSLLGHEHKELTHSQLLTDSFLSGATSGAIAALVTTPFDVGKTRQQTVLHGPNSTAQQVRDLPESRTMPRFLWHIYCTEGMQGLFKGWAARCLKVAPACAIMISSYEIGKKMARNVNERKEGLADS